MFHMRQKKKSVRNGGGTHANSRSEVKNVPDPCGTIGQAIETSAALRSTVPAH